MSKSEADSRVVIAELHKPRGIRGELIGRSLTDVPGRFESLKEAQLRLVDGQDVPVTLTRARQHKDDWLFQFAGVDSIEAANRFRGAELWVPPSERAQLPSGQFFESDLIGLAVIDGRSGQALGVVEDLQQYGGPPLLVLTYEGREVLIPFVPEICEVNLEAKVIRATLPDGLLEL